MAKAAEDLRNEAKAKAEEKERYINERVPPCDTQGKGQGRLQKHKALCSMECECSVIDLLNKIDTCIIDFMYKPMQSYKWVFIFLHYMNTCEILQYFLFVLKECMSV